MEKLVAQTLPYLKDEKVILYPTDTLWGLGCDAFSSSAIEKIKRIKQRAENKNFILLVSSFTMLEKYVKVPPLVRDFLEKQTRPTSVIYNEVLNKNLPLAEDGSVAIRIVQNDFCKELIEAFGKPIVSTSANISGEPSAQCFAQISEQIKQSADFVVPYLEENTEKMASQLVKIEDSKIVFLRS